MKFIDSTHPGLTRVRCTGRMNCARRRARHRLLLPPLAPAFVSIVSLLHLSSELLLNSFFKFYSPHPTHTPVGDRLTLNVFRF